MKENKASITAYTVLQGIMYVAKRTKYKDLVPKDMKDLGEKVLSCSEEGQKEVSPTGEKGLRPWGENSGVYIFTGYYTALYSA